MHFSQQIWRCRDRDYLPHDSRDAETNAPVSQDGKQMKEDAAAGENCEGRHVTDRAGKDFSIRKHKVNKQHDAVNVCETLLVS